MDDIICTLKRMSHKIQNSQDDKEIQGSISYLLGFIDGQKPPETAPNEETTGTCV